jgi:PAS domain S-box-containing protein
MNILLVDDHENNIYLLESMLKAKGHTIQSAPNGARALKVLSGGGIDMIISDILMPVMDGFQLCRTVKTDQNMRSIPFIIYTATYTGPKDEAFARKIGADRFIVKPCEPDVFLQAVTDVMTEAGNRGGDIQPEPVTEKEVFKLYNERLIRKLEQKMMETEYEIQARLVIEKELRESEEKFRSITEDSADAIFITDQQGNYQYVNKAASSMLGYSQKELMAMNIADISQPEDVDKSRELFVKILKTGKIYAEIVMVRKDKTTLPADLNAVVLPNQLVYGSCRDLTQRKKMEQELEQSRNYLEEQVKERTLKLNDALRDSETNRERIETIFKSVSEGLILTDITHRIMMMNTLAEDWLDIRFSMVYNRLIDDSLNQKNLIKLIKDTGPGQTSSTRIDIEIPGTNKSRKIILEASAKNIMYKDNKSIGTIITLRDVTKEQEMDQMKTDFLSTTAHELRTPLTTIQGFSEVLLTRKDLKKDEKEKFLRYINKQSVNLAQILNDLLDICRIESGKDFELKIEKCIPNDIITELLENYRTSFPKFRFTADLEENGRPVLADPGKIEQILQNLLSNAIKYSPEGGEIRISTAIKGKNYQVSIQDQGIGMTGEQVKKIFEKFYRADSSDTAPTGTGLGMSIVKLIIDKHNGKIWVESEPKKGTRVVFTLPIG